MTVREINLETGEVTERDYTEDELAAITLASSEVSEALPPQSIPIDVVRDDPK